MAMRNRRLRLLMLVSVLGGVGCSQEGPSEVDTQALQQAVEHELDKLNAAQDTSAEQARQDSAPAAAEVSAGIETHLSGIPADEEQPLGAVQAAVEDGLGVVQAAIQEARPSGRESAHAKTQTGIAAYYSNRYHGRRTANGERYSKDGLTAAHKRYPFGTRVRVTNLKNDKSVVVRINDRGPRQPGRIIDVSRRTARELDFLQDGLTKVELAVVELGTGETYWGDETGIAAYYSNRYHGRRTASGERYSKDALTAAHKRYPFGTRVRVTNLKNDKSVVVRINDRGPRQPGRIIDVSRRTARELGFLQDGLASVELEVLEFGG